MQKWEEKEMERQEAYAEGREEGERVGEARINKLIVYLLEPVSYTHLQLIIIIMIFLN